MLPRETVDAPTLEVVKAELEKALSNLRQWELSLLMVGGWDWMNFRAHIKPLRFHELSTGVGYNECSPGVLSISAIL